MFFIVKKNDLVMLGLAIVMIILIISVIQSVSAVGDVAEGEFIKWVDYNVSLAAMNDAYDIDITTVGEEVHISWIELLAYMGAKTGGSFNEYKTGSFDAVVGRLKNGEVMEDIAKDMKYYNYYYEAYSAVLGEFVGTYMSMGEEKYGLKVYSPIAKTFPFNHYKDFGAGRSFGYKRKHLGNDLLGAVGTPIIAIEGGTIEELGWNMYGGWRIGIRSLDKKRYYYYAHLRKNYPFHQSLEIGKTVEAGDVIGYLGRSGYSTVENTNNIQTPHLHLGIQLIFDESQKEGLTEIWIDVYNIVRFLQRNQMEVVRDAETKEWNRVVK